MDNTVEIELTDEEFIILAKEAHMLDVTFNQYVNKILKDYLDTLA